MSHAPYSLFTSPVPASTASPPSERADSGRAGFASGVFRRRPRSATQARILLADPDAAVRARLGDALADRGYDVVLAATAHQAASYALDGLDLVVASFDLSHAAFGAPVIALERPVVVDQVLDCVLAELIEAVMGEPDDLEAGSSV